MLELPDTAPTPPNETLDRIGAAFHATLERDGSASVVVTFALAALVLAVLLVLWVRKDARKDRTEQTARQARHVAVMSTIPPPDVHREWLVVPAHLRLSVSRVTDRGRIVFDNLETQSVSAGSLTFLSHATPVPGITLTLNLYLGEAWPLSLRGVVSSVEASTASEAASLVTVRLGPISNRERERLVRWVAREDARRVAEARRGHVCTVCKRPLADDKVSAHATCSKKKPGLTPDAA